MPKYLNDFDELHMQELLQSDVAKLREYQTLLPSYAEPKRRNRLLNGMRDYAYDAGVLSYGLDKAPATVWNFFGRSVEACLEMFAIGALPECNTPVVLLDGVYLSVVLNLWDNARALAELKRYSPVRFEEGSFVADEVVMGYLVAFLAYLQGKLDEAGETARMNSRRCEQRREGFAKSFGLRSHALLSLVKEDEGSFQTSLAEIVQAHASEARKGRLREDTRGLLCLDALALTSLAERAGIRPAIQSPYLPLTLVKH